MQTVNIHAAKTQLSRLVDEAAAGAEIIIARAGRPVAKLVPLTAPQPRPKRTLGRLARRLRVPGDFDAPLPDAPLPDDVLAGFEGR
jgi:prevent-host-death family protein